MKLTIKTLDQKTFHVEFDESRTVLDLKTHLHHCPEVGVKPEQQQLIYAGRVLSNEHTLKTYSIDERKFLVIMARKATIEQPPADDKATQEKKSSKSSEQAGPSCKISQTNTCQRPVGEQHNQAAAVPTPPSLAQPTAAIIAAHDALVQEIMNMGYPEPEVRRAMLASFNNPDRAIEYLIEGIPPLPDDLPDDQPTMHAPNCTALNNSSSTNNNNGTSPNNAQSPLSFLRNDPRFSQMRRVIQHRPELLSTVLAKIGETNPPLLALIREHQDEFVRMLNDEAEDPYDYDMDNNDDVIEVVLTAEELLVVERLAGLGFPRELVVQAYLACEKNEEQTADFLCRHMEEQ